MHNKCVAGPPMICTYSLAPSYCNRLICPARRPIESIRSDLRQVLEPDIRFTRTGRIYRDRVLRDEAHRPGKGSPGRPRNFCKVVRFVAYPLISVCIIVELVHLTQHFNDDICLQYLLERFPHRDASYKCIFRLRAANASLIIFDSTGSQVDGPICPCGRGHICPSRWAPRVLGWRSFPGLADSPCIRIDNLSTFSAKLIDCGRSLPLTN